MIDEETIPAELRAALSTLVPIALSEDWGPRNEDCTTTSILLGDEVRPGKSIIVFKRSGVFCGFPALSFTLKMGAPALHASLKVREGAWLEAGTEAIHIEGPINQILRIERIVLNWIQLCSGIATQTANFVKAFEGSGVVVLDTRKGWPGYRAISRYAVRIGGGQNHRMGLYDKILIKDNHLHCVGGVQEAIRRVRLQNPHNPYIIIETSTMKEVSEAITAGVDRIMLDNWPKEKLKETVSLIHKNLSKCAKRIETEVSGGVGLEDASLIKEAQPNFVSIGSLSHSVRAADVSLRLV